MRTKVLVLLVSLTMLTVLATPASAVEVEGTEDLEWLVYVSIEIDNEDGQTLEISYEVKVTAGVNVDVYFMDQDGYDDLVANRTFEFYKDYSRTDTRDAEEEWVWANRGTFYVVIRNAGPAPGDVSTVEYNVQWTAGPLGFNWLWCIVVIVIIVILTLVLAFMKRRDEEDGTWEGAGALEEGTPPDTGGSGRDGPIEESAAGTAGPEGPREQG